MHGAVVKVGSVQEASLSCVDRLKGQNPKRADDAGGERPQQGRLMFKKSPLHGLAGHSAGAIVTLLLASNCRPAKAGKAHPSRQHP